MCPMSCKGFWGEHRGEMSIKVKGKYTSKSKSKNMGCILVEPMAWDSNERSFYLHAFICYAYHGPPPNVMLHPCAAHSCHHRLCLNPLHIRWVSKSIDKLEDWGHRKRKRG